MERRSEEAVAESRALADAIVETVVETAHEEQSVGGTEAASDFMQFLLEGLISTTVYSALRSPDAHPNLTQEQRLAMATRNLLEAKSLVQEAVSEGFTQAYLQFCGQQTEHVTEVRMVDDGLDDDPPPH